MKKLFLLLLLWSQAGLAVENFCSADRLAANPQLLQLAIEARLQRTVQFIFKHYPVSKSQIRVKKLETVVNSEGIKGVRLSYEVKMISDEGTPLHLAGRKKGTTRLIPIKFFAIPAAMTDEGGNFTGSCGAYLSSDNLVLVSSRSGAVLDVVGGMLARTWFDPVRRKLTGYGTPAGGIQF